MNEQPRDDLGFELWRYEIGAVDVILFDWAEGANLYTTAGTARTPREAAEHDGPTIKDGQYRDFVIEEDRSGLVGGYHPHAGRRETHAPSVEFDQPVTLLTELNHVE